MKNKITYITTKHLKSGKKKNSQFCPIALALQDNNYDRPVVITDNISYDYIDEDSIRQMNIKDTSSKLRDVINLLDQYLPLKPFRIIETKDQFQFLK